jgi:hypothetical protein
VISPAVCLRALAFVTVLAFSVVPATTARAQQAARTPSISAPAAARPGDVVIVTLTDWPQGVVTVGVCSNAGARGTQDCNVAGDNAIAVRDDRPVQLDLEVSNPPGTCPCVIRATTPSGSPVVTTPFVVVGVPEGPIVQPASPPAAEQMKVRSEVKDASTSFPSSLVPAVGGSVHKVLLVTVTNFGNGPADLHVVAQVGKHAQKEAIGTRDAKAVAAGATRTLRVPFVISAPAWGGYKVVGTVYGGTSPVRFATTTDNDPWLLWLLVPVALILVAEIMRARDRRERKALDAARQRQVAAAEAAAIAAAAPVVLPEDPAPTAEMLRPVTAVLHDVESSPDVGIPYAKRSATASYDPYRNGNGVGNGAALEHLSTGAPAPLGASVAEPPGDLTAS